ncbi:type II secretion system protein G [Rhodanobacter thiooxydans]|uniref:Type II secretion system protein G n=1 Tax=Rhodanobacter thiooxydans TaxID=416169 RepID=A0A154QGV9_9GAMM|nr:type II secretion system protein [Rhodanobacter thiooxydans]EIL98056.1 type II secretion system protein G [Rhodanobacter thiooxydans LCS2]KZC23071.1 type II secretion system protein G [Rhodanobacter thiooxydans]MCW0203584.1 type II secretion system GspH family protein [Rhodanobacter thiooxydans]
MRLRRSGFSLIELMVVMAIIAVLVSIALPRYQGSVENAKLVALKSNLRVLRSAIDRYHDDKARFPASLQVLADEHYLRDVPVDPITDSAQTWVTVEETLGGDTGVADVHSGAKGTDPRGNVYSEL